MQELQHFKDLQEVAAAGGGVAATGACAVDDAPC